MFYNILDKKRLSVLPLFRSFKKDFYLAGGTALALQIGHRDSVDFDFFGQANIDTKKLFEEVSETFDGYKILKIQEEKNTLTVLIDGEIKLSFFGYKYKLLNEGDGDENLRIASVEDIACMKLSAITSRANNKDYIDLYYILQKTNIKDLLESASKKLPDLDTGLILKSLVYFDDIEIEPIIFKNNNFVDMGEVKDFIKKKVRETMN